MIFGKALSQEIVKESPHPYMLFIVNYLILQLKFFQRLGLRLIVLRFFCFSLPLCHYISMRMYYNITALKRRENELHILSNHTILDNEDSCIENIYKVSSPLYKYENVL